MVGSSNLNESKAFYDVVLAVMGIVSIYEMRCVLVMLERGNKMLSSI